MIANIENIMTTDPKRLTTNSNFKTAKLNSAKQPVVAEQTPAPKKDMETSAMMPSSIRNQIENTGASEAITPAVVEDAINEAN